MNAANFLNHGPFFGGLGGEDAVGFIDADHRPVGGDGDDFEAVNLAKLLRLGEGGAGHAADAGVEGDEVLDGDRTQDTAGAADGETLPGFEGGLDAVGPAAVLSDTAFELVDQLDPAVLDENAVDAYLVETEKRWEECAREHPLPPALREKLERARRELLAKQS